MSSPSHIRPAVPRQQPAPPVPRPHLINRSPPPVEAPRVVARPGTVPDVVYEELRYMWSTLPPEMQELSTLYPCTDFLDERRKMPCRPSMYMMSGSSLGCLVGRNPFKDVFQQLDHKFSVLDRATENFRQQEGVEWEPLAAQKYLDLQSATLDRGRQVKLQTNCERIVCPAFPLLSSTPDGLLTESDADPVGAPTRWPTTRKLLEIKTVDNSRKLRVVYGSKTAPPLHVELQASMHMLCTKVPTVDVFYFTNRRHQGYNLDSKLFGMAWDDALQEWLLHDILPQAIQQYKRIWLPEFLNHRADVERWRRSAAEWAAEREEEEAAALERM